MNETLVEQLRELRLTGMLAGVKEQLESSQYLSLTFEERLGFIVEKEYLRRKDNRIKENIRKANLKLSACVNDIQFSNGRNLNKKDILELSQSNWIKRNENLIITGSTGVGKSYIACALGHQYCSQGSKVSYYKTSEVVSNLSLARASGKYYEVLMKLTKIPLLILDEFLREPLKEQGATDLLDLIDDRSTKSSIIFCSQLPVSDWHKNILNPTIADAIMDRITFSSHRIELKGETMRKKLSNLGNEKTTI